MLEPCHSGFGLAFWASSTIHMVIWLLREHSVFLANNVNFLQVVYVDNLRIIIAVPMPLLGSDNKLLLG